MKGSPFVGCPPLRGSMTENAAELQLKEEKWQEPFLSFSLYGLSWWLSVCLYVQVCIRERERRRILDRQKASRRKPLGSNKSGLHWTEESWRILRGKTGVHSILGQRLGSDTSLILYNTRTHTHTYRQGWNYSYSFPPLVPHYHVKALASYLVQFKMWNTPVIKYREQKAMKDTFAV